MDVFALLPVWAFCPHEPAVSWLLVLSPGVLGRGLESEFHLCQGPFARERGSLISNLWQQNGLGDPKVSFDTPAE